MLAALQQPTGVDNRGGGGGPWETTYSFLVFLKAISKAGKVEGHGGGSGGFDFDEKTLQKKSLI